MKTKHILIKSTCNKCLGKKFIKVTNNEHIVCPVCKGEGFLVSTAKLLKTDSMWEDLVLIECNNKQDWVFKDKILH